MKLNIASPTTGTQKTIDVEDENKIRTFFDKTLGQELAGEAISPEYAGYVFKIVGGSDKQGFPMKLGVLANSRVKLLLNRGTLGYQAWRGRKGERRRKTVRGSIVGPDIAVLCLKITKQGSEHIDGLTNKENPRQRGPKRASKIRKLFALSKTDDVRAFVLKRKKPSKVNAAGKKIKARTVAPKVQRLVTPTVLKRRKQKRAMLKTRWEKAREERTSYQNKLQRLKVVTWQRRLAKKHRQQKAALSSAKQQTTETKAKAPTTAASAKKTTKH